MSEELGIDGQPVLKMEDSKQAQLYKIRHSLAHIMAQAVLEYRPGTKLGFGPPIEDGFYYDFILSAPLTEEDFSEIEKRMKKIIRINANFEQQELGIQEGLRKIDEMGEPYKREYIEELIQKKNIKTISFYQSGPFLDMCTGPHVQKASEIDQNCFKLKSIAGAYWRGDSKNTMMTRIYAWAFLTGDECKEFVRNYQEGLKRDHKKLGKELKLFSIEEDIGRGLPLWHPNGTVLRDEIEKLMKELEFKAGYDRVVSPHLAKADLYYKTGHMPYYAEHMYPLMEVKEKNSEGTDDVRETYCLKPMNCPHHHLIFKSDIRSYRELPIRYAEFGQVYRFEDSGALSGLLRVRSISQNDAHIYCTEDQIKEEFLAVMKMHQDLYGIVGFKNYHMRFSTWDPNDPKGKEKFVDNPAAWEFTQNKIKEAMNESGLPYIEGKGEAAFYGPKIDFQLRTVTGREETASTNQLDFAIPQRLGMTYVGPDNKEHHPYVIHRAPSGSHERFTAFLIEHYGGAFPTWLAPVQVKVVSVSEKFNDYGEKIVKKLRSQFIRAEMDRSSETMGKKIRNATKEKIPNTLIVGEKEVLDQTVTLRRYGIEKQETMSVAAFEEWVNEKIKSRALD